MEPKGQSSTLLNGAILSLTLASFAAGQEEKGVEVSPPEAQQKIESVEQNASLPTISEGERLFQQELSRFESIDRSKFQPLVFRSLALTPSGKVDYIYYFTPINPDKTQAVMVIGLLPDADSQSRLDEQLSERKFVTSDRPYADLAQQLDKSEKSTATEPQSDLSRTARLLKLVSQALLSLLVAGIASAKLYGMYLKRRGVKQLEKSVAEREKAGDAIDLADSTVHTCRYEIKGGIQPVLCFKLAPGERIVAQQGAMLRRNAAIDSTLASAKAIGLSGAVTGLGKSLLAGESLFYQSFRNKSDKDSELVLGPSAIGQILPLDLAQYPHGLSASNGAFFAATPGVKMQIDGSGGWKGMFSGTGMFLQRFSGVGNLFLYTAGVLECVELNEGEKIVADSDSIFAWEKGVTVDLKTQTLSDTALSGEGLIIAHVSGKGKAWFAARGRSDDSSSNKSGGLASSFFRGYLSS